MKFLKEYYSDDQYRTARVMLDDEVPVVEFYEGLKMRAISRFEHHTVQYAEDAAENFTLGILKF